MTPLSPIIGVAAELAKAPEANFESKVTLPLSAFVTAATPVCFPARLSLEAVSYTASPEASVTMMRS